MAERYGPGPNEDAATRRTTSGVHVGVRRSAATGGDSCPSRPDGDRGDALGRKTINIKTIPVLTCFWSEEGTSILEILRSATEVAIERVSDLAVEDFYPSKADHLMSKNSNKTCGVRDSRRGTCGLCMYAGQGQDPAKVGLCDVCQWEEMGCIPHRNSDYPRQAMVSTVVVGFEGGRSQRHLEDGSCRARPAHAKQLVTGAWNPSLRLESAASLTPSDHRVCSYDHHGDPKASKTRPTPIEGYGSKRRFRPRL
eukprot:jgi/Undpi1/12219/HiC_scaffold_5.g01895.m1